jgi:ABC-type maltose transport system permease subunit
VTGAADTGTAVKAAVREERRSRWTREEVESRIITVLKWIGVVFFVTVTVFPFLYMVLLSVRPIADLARDPGQLFVPFERLTFGTYDEVLRSVADGGRGSCRSSATARSSRRSPSSRRSCSRSRARTRSAGSSSSGAAR